MRRIVLPLVLLLGLLIGWWLTRVPDAPPHEAKGVNAAPAAAPAAPPRVVLRRPATPSAGRRPAPPTPTEAPTEAPKEAPAAPTEPEANAGPIDRRRPDQQDGGGLQATIKQMMDFASEDIDRCIHAWAAVDPTVQGEVMIGFQFDKDGLSEAWVTGRDDMPDASRTCFADAVYDVDWSGLTDDPVEVTWRFAVGADAAP